MTTEIRPRSKASVAPVPPPAVLPPEGYDGLVGGIAGLLEQARRASARAVNALLTATYWEIGRRIVEFEQAGEARAEYGEALLSQLASDLTASFGRGFGPVNLSQMKKFYLLWPASRIFQTPSEKFAAGAAAFPLPWSAYVRLLAVKSEAARGFYETEALRGGWSVRQLDRQIQSQFYERTALSRDRAGMLDRGPSAMMPSRTMPSATCPTRFSPPSTAPSSRTNSSSPTTSTRPGGLSNGEGWVGGGPGGSGSSRSRPGRLQTAPPPSPP